MSILDELTKIPVFSRLYWEYVEGVPAPNDYCNLVNVGITTERLAWEENDSHYRNRIKERLCQSKTKQ